MWAEHRVAADAGVGGQQRVEVVAHALQQVGGQPPARHHVAAFVIVLDLVLRQQVADARRRVHGVLPDAFPGC